MALSKRARRWLVIGGTSVVVLVVGAVLAWNLLFSDSTRALGVDEAVERFRSSTTVAATAPTTATSEVTTAPPSTVASTVAATTTTVPALTTPQPGVYVYATTGDESVDALTGAHHTYPEQTTISVVASGCGVRLRWAPLVERYEEWDVCPTPDGGLVTTGYTSYHTFFNQVEDDHYVCPAGTVYLPATPVPGSTWTVSCTHENTLDTTVWTVVGREPVVVGGVTVDAVHVHGTDGSTDPDGSTTQTTIDVWLRPSDGLTLKRLEDGSSTTKSPIGDVHYREHIELQLLDLAAPPLTRPGGCGRSGELRPPSGGGCNCGMADQPWLMRTYSGHSTARASNELYRTNLAKGQTGLSIAFDLPTQTGYDPDHPLAKGRGGQGRGAGRPPRPHAHAARRHPARRR